MKAKLLSYALISSPLLALYAVSHPLIFGVARFEMVVIPVFAITLNIFIIWLINIYVVLRFRALGLWKKVLLSYAFNTIFQILFTGFGQFLPAPSAFVELRQNFLLHPILTSIAINVIIIIICQATEASFLRTEAELKATELELESSEAQRKLLIQQLQPHFLFNALSVLKSLIQETPHQAEAYTVKLSDFLRYSVASQGQEVVEITQEIEFVNDYIALQRVRFGESFRYETTLPTDVLRHKVPIFALQTLIENAFKHNSFTEKRPLILHISVLDNTHLKIWNNKATLRTTEHSATGLSNLNRRYQLIAGQGIEIMESAEYFSVLIPIL